MKTLQERLPRFLREWLTNRPSVHGAIRACARFNVEMDYPTTYRSDLRLWLDDRRATARGARLAVWLGLLEYANAVGDDGDRFVRLTKLGTHYYNLYIRTEKDHVLS